MTRAAWFADLRLEVPITKAVLLRDPIDGFATEDEYIAFAEMLGCKKRRPAPHTALAEVLPRLLDKFGAAARLKWVSYGSRSR